MMRRIAIALAALCASHILLTAQPAQHLTLAEARRLALANNPRLSAAKLTAAAAYQVPQQYRANLAPTMYSSLTGVGADSGSRLAAGGLNNPVVYSRFGSGLTVSQLVTDFGRTGNLIGMAKLQAEAQNQAAQTTRADILLATDRAYFEVLLAEAVLKVAEQTVASRQLVADQAAALAESKLKSMLDVSFAKVNLADAKLLLAKAQNDVKAAQAELATAMGLPRENAFALAEEPMPEPLPDRIDAVIAEALNNRPDLKDRRLEQSAADRFAKAEHALYYPTVGILGTAGFVPTGQEAVPGRYGAIGLNVTIPIFNGGLFKARQAEAELKAQAAARDVNSVENQIVRDVKVAYLNAQTAAERVSLTEQLLNQAKLSLDLAQSRYDLGLSSMVELSQAQLNFTSAQIANASARYEYQDRRAVLTYQTGGY